MQQDEPAPADQQDPIPEAVPAEPVAPPVPQAEAVAAPPAGSRVPNLVDCSDSDVELK